MTTEAHDLDVLRSRFAAAYARLLKHISDGANGDDDVELLVYAAGLSAQTQRLRHEHAQLMRLANDLQSLLRDAAPADSLLIDDCAARIMALVRQLEYHEARENLVRGASAIEKPDLSECTCPSEAWLG